MTYLSAVLTIILLSFNSFAEETIGDRAVERIKNQPITINLDLLNWDLSDNLEASVDSGIRIFPNRDRGTFSRFEPFRFRIANRNGVDTSVLSLTNTNSVSLSGEFVRQFSSYYDAINLVRHPPYVLNQRGQTTARIPHTHSRAKNLVPGDYFRYQLSTAIEISAALAHDVLGVAKASLKKRAVLYGDFQIEVYRKVDNKILVRASSLKEGRRSTQFTISNKYNLRLFSANTLTRQGNKLIFPKNYLEININDNKEGVLFAVEYLFDLNQPRAATAYDDFMNFQNWSLLDVAKVHNPLRSDKNTRHILATTVESAEKVSREDEGLSEDKAAVRRLARSQTNFWGQGSGVKINLKWILRAKEQRQLIQQDIRLSTDPGEGVNQFFRIATANRDEKYSGWLNGGRHTKLNREANVLFELTPEMRIKDFLEMNFLVESRNSFLRGRDADNIIGQIYKIMPGHYQGPFNSDYPGTRDFVNKIHSLTNKYNDTKLEIVIFKKAFRLLAELPSETIDQTIDDFIELVFDDQANANQSEREYGDLGLVKNHTCDRETPAKRCFYQHYVRQINKIKRTLPRILSFAVNNNYESQWRELVALQKQELFDILGSGILTRLIQVAAHNNKESFYDYVFVKFLSTDKNGNDIEFLPREDLVRPSYLIELVKIRNRILKRKYDPSFFEETD